MNNDIDIIKRFYSGLNSNDIEGVISLMDKDVFRIEFEELPNSGTFRGHVQMREHIHSGRSTWAEGSCEPTEFIHINNKIIAMVQVKVRLKNASEWINGVVADVFSLNNGLITEFSSYTSKEKAMASAQDNSPRG